MVGAPKSGHCRRLATIRRQMVERRISSREQGGPNLVKVPDTVELYHPVLDRTVTVPTGSEAGLLADPPKGGGWVYADTKKSKKASEEDK